MKNGEIVYHCVRSLDENGVEIFAKPVEYKLRPNYLTIQPAGGFMDIQEYGEFTSQTNKGVAQPYELWKGVFKSGDRFYLGIVPKGYKTEEEPVDGWGFDANAQIVAVKEQNQTIALTLRDIVK